MGVVTASIAYQYAKEVFPEDTSFLKLGLTYPLPMELIREFAASVETLYVIEELEPFMEEQIKAAGIPCVGKELTGRLYELTPAAPADLWRGAGDCGLAGAGGVPSAGSLPGLSPPGLLLHHVQGKGLRGLRRHRLLHPGRLRAAERHGYLYLHGRRLLRGHGHGQGL